MQIKRLWKERQHIVFTERYPVQTIQMYNVRWPGTLFRNSALIHEDEMWLLGPEHFPRLSEQIRQFVTV
jgi:hypothetical protein